MTSMENDFPRNSSAKHKNNVWNNAVVLNTTEAGGTVGIMHL